MMLGDDSNKATLRMAQQELEDLYLGVPDNSVDLTFKDLASTSASSSLPVASGGGNDLPPPPHTAGAVDDERNKRIKTTSTGLLVRSSTNIFTYRPLEDREDAGSGGGGLLQLPLSPPSPPGLRHHEDNRRAGPASSSAGVGTNNNNNARAGTTVVGGDHRRSRRPDNNNVSDGHQERHNRNSNYRQRQGIPHSNICAVCNNYVYFFRHRCLVCGRVYCRRCVGAGMGDMTEGRKCIDCLGLRFSHRYIHRASDAATGCCLCLFWGYYPSAKAVAAQELIWAEKGPAPRRRPRHHAAGSSLSYTASSGDSYSTSTIASASMSMTLNSDNSMALMKMNGLAGNSNGSMPASASSSFVASYAPNPHAFPL